MSTQTFPQEIVDIIIDCAWDLQREFARVNTGAHRFVDGQKPFIAFNVFALVSRSWVARARHCAFRDLIFRRKWSFDSRQFGIALLEHPLCTIREHVLRLHFGRASRSGHNLADISYLRSFRNLKSLSLHDLVFEAWSWPVESSIFESVLLATLENLDLEDCTFPNVDCLIQLIACATGLRSLRCSEIFVHADKPMRVVQSIPQHLSELSITVAYDSCQKVLEWISSAPIPPRIDSLELQAISDESVPVVSGALHVLGPSVVTLSLLLRSYEHDQSSPNIVDSFATAADLSTLRNLRHLVTACSFLPYGRMGAEVPLILARLAENCKTLQRITFHIHGVDTKEDILTMPWDAIIATLNGSSFRQLERIAFQLSPPWGDEQRDATRDMLKEIVGRELLANVSIVCRSDGDWSSS